MTIIRQNRPYIRLLFVYLCHILAFDCLGIRLEYAAVQFLSKDK